MAKEDFCFTYYDGDAARDMAHMNRTERGAYSDIIISQRKFGRLTLLQIKKILGKDFEECWPSVELVLQHEEEKYFIEWVENSVAKSKKHSRFQSENGKKGGRPSKINPNESELKPLEDGYGNGNEDVNEYIKEEEELLIPKMFSNWKKLNSSYPSDQGKDFSALNDIAKFICIQKGILYNPTDKHQKIEILQEWEKIAGHVISHKFFKAYSLKQISNHSQSIFQDLNNGNDQRNNNQGGTTKHLIGSGGFGKL